MIKSLNLWLSFGYQFTDAGTVAHILRSVRITFSFRLCVTCQEKRQLRDTQPPIQIPRKCIFLSLHKLLSFRILSTCLVKTPFIIFRNVAGELAKPKNITSSSKRPSLVMNAVLCSSPSFIWMFF